MGQQIQFKENPNAGNLGLQAAGRSKIPGCYDVVQPRQGRDSRWVTGLDEISMEVNAIKDSKLREAEITKIKKLREELEIMTGYKLDAKSDFWASYFVQLNPDKYLDLDNPMDRIAYTMVLANKFAAPSQRDAFDPIYNTAKYYAFRDFDDVSDRVFDKNKYYDAVAAFKELQKSPEKERLIGRFLDLPIAENTPKDNMDDMFMSSLDTYKTTNFVDRFLSAIDKSPEEIQAKLVFADAIKLGVIRQRDGLFQRGNVTLGRAGTPDEAVNFLLSPKNSGEFLSIQEEIKVKRKFG